MTPGDVIRLVRGACMIDVTYEDIEDALGIGVGSIEGEFGG